MLEPRTFVVFISVLFIWLTIKFVVVVACFQSTPLNFKRLTTNRVCLINANVFLTALLNFISFYEYN